MGTDEEIGREFFSFLGSSDAAIGDFIRVGAAARKAVGERPRMMIEGMTVEKILKIINDVWINIGKNNLGSLKPAAIEIHRLVNTPAPDVDRDALAKAMIWKHYNTMWPFPPPSIDYKTPDKLWAAQSETSKASWRAVAEMVEERK